MHVIFLKIIRRFLSKVEARWPQGLRGTGSRPWPGTLCCVSMQDTLYSCSAFAISCMNGYRWRNLAMDQHPIQGGLEILLVTSCYRNRDKLLPDETLGLSAQTYPFFLFQGLVRPNDNCS